MKKKRKINKMVRKNRTSKRKKLNSKRSDLKKNYTNRKKKNISINISSKLNRTKHKKRLRKTYNYENNTNIPRNIRKKTSIQVNKSGGSGEGKEDEKSEVNVLIEQIKNTNTVIKISDIIKRLKEIYRI